MPKAAFMSSLSRRPMDFVKRGEIVKDASSRTAAQKQNDLSKSTYQRQEV